MAGSAWMRHWFSGAAAGSSTDTAGERIRFSAQLIPGLSRDHQDLLALYDEIERMAVDNRCASITAALVGFKSRFDLHVLSENLHFYGYLEQRLDRQAELLATVKRLRAEMNDIARSVTKFVRKYDEAGVRPATVKAFLEELRVVGALLRQRIEREEQDLYPLYRP